MIRKRLGRTLGTLALLGALAAGEAPVDAATVAAPASGNSLREVQARLDVLIRKAHEGMTKGNLGAIRSALSIYYGDHEGRYPASLDELTVDGKYLVRVPSAVTGKHDSTNGVVILDRVADEADLLRQVRDTGKWLYVADEDSPMFGTIVVDCTHTDSTGRVWHRY